MIKSTQLDEYFALMEQKPEFFTPSDIYPIVTDRKTLEDFAAAAKRPVGVVYKSDYHLLVVDLISDGNGGYFTYERTLPERTGRGVVCIPEYQGKYILLKQFRHPIRNTQLCLPRGFGENGLSSAQNAEKELFEELGAKAKSIERLGEVTPDSGFLGGTVDIFLCRVDSYAPDSTTEGIKEIVLYSYNEVSEMIKNNQITDSFTICAFSLLTEK